MLPLAPRREQRVVVKTRILKEVVEEIGKASRITGKSKAELLREAIETFFKKP